jgi:RNA polymerase sigma-70 factor (ECF subfamily)
MSDHELLARCLEKRQRGWEDFVDRFLGLVLHVIDHTTLVREIRLGRDDRDVLCEKVFTAIAHDDFRILRNYQGRSSLTTYLTVAARRVVVRILLNYSLVGAGYERRAA